MQLCVYKCKYKRFIYYIISETLVSGAQIVSKGVPVVRTMFVYCSVHSPSMPHYNKFV